MHLSWPERQEPRPLAADKNMMTKMITTIVITMIMSLMTDGNQMVTMMSWPERQEPRPLAVEKNIVMITRKVLVNH